MNIKVGDIYKTTRINSNVEFYIVEKVIAVYPGYMTCINIAASQKEAIGCENDYSLTWFKVTGFRSIKINHHTSKLGKILYK